MKKIACFVLACIVFATGFIFYACKKEENAHNRYEITVEYAEETKTLMGTAKVTFENRTDNEISILKFQLYPNAYRKGALYAPISIAQETEGYYDGESYGEMTISSVQGSKNWEVMGEDENILYVYLERSLFPGDSVVIDIGFITKLANVNHRTGVTEHTVNLGNFYPTLCGIRDGAFTETVYAQIGEPFYFDYADYKVTLTLPKEYAVASSGERIGERTLESKNAYTMSATNVRDFSMILSKEFALEELEVSGKRLRYFYYADETPKKTLATIKECFSFYEECFGPYPYTMFEVTQSSLCMDAARYPALSLLSDKLTDETKLRVIARETARQWWGTGVGIDPTTNAWQEEGLAEYAALTFFENYEKYGWAREAIVKQAMAEYRSYYDVYGSVLGRTDTRMTRALKEYLSEYEYKCLARDKAVIMLDSLRKSVGDDKFFASLKRYYKANLYKLTTEGDLIGAFEKNGLDVGGFFESFLQGKGIL